MKHSIILASASKRRSKILKECGIKHRVAVSNAPEKMDHKRGIRFNVLHNARIKAEKIAARQKEGYIIGADTVVLLGRQLIGKPKTKGEAKAFLNLFSGKTLLVYTGLWVIDAKKGKSVSGVDKSRIWVRELSKGEIDKLVNIAGPYDKAGGFSIEGTGTFIFDNIKGSFYNILGLPMMKLDKLFRELGVNLLDLAIKNSS
jgi:septum formation protein